MKEDGAKYGNNGYRVEKQGTVGLKSFFYACTI